MVPSLFPAHCNFLTCLHDYCPARDLQSTTRKVDQVLPLPVHVNGNSQPSFPPSVLAELLAWIPSSSSEKAANLYCFVLVFCRLLLQHLCSASHFWALLVLP